MREFSVCGLGNAIVDIFLELSEPEFSELGFEKGTMRLVEPEEQKSAHRPFSAAPSRAWSEAAGRWLIP